MKYSLQRTAGKYCPKAGPRNLCKCGRQAGYRTVLGEKQRIQKLVIVSDDAGNCRWGGLLTCNSVWCCPICASLIAGIRTQELEVMVGEHLDAGKAVVFGTLTIRHDMRHRLKPTRQALSEAWAETRGDGRIRRRLAHFGYICSNRVLEVTVGPKHGWHPHVHTLLFLEVTPSAEELRELEESLFNVWSGKVARAGLPCPERFKEDVDGNLKPLGVALELVSKKEIGRYMMKLGIAAEVSTTLGKAARGDNRTMWQVLSSINSLEKQLRTEGITAGESNLLTERLRRDVRLWREWCVGMKGAKQVTWTKGANDLRDRYGLEPELTDEQIMELEESRGLPVAHIDGPWFEGMTRRNPALRWELLELAEDQGGSAVMFFIQGSLWEQPPPWSNSS